jgi:hypothetical protein
MLIQALTVPFLRAAPAIIRWLLRSGYCKQIKASVAIEQTDRLVPQCGPERNFHEELTAGATLMPPVSIA